MSVRLPKRISCGSRWISISKPNWLTGLATIGVNDIGTLSGFTTDASATAKLIQALLVLHQQQVEIEAGKRRDHANRKAVRGEARS